MLPQRISDDAVSVENSAATPSRDLQQPAMSSTPPLAALFGSYAVFAVVAPVDRGPTICPFRLVTWRRCPLCGLTRATHAPARGRVRESLSLHRLAPLFWVGVVVWFVASRGHDTAPTSVITR